MAAEPRPAEPMNFKIKELTEEVADPFLLTFDMGGRFWWSNMVKSIPGSHVGSATQRQIRKGDPKVFGTNPNGQSIRKAQDAGAVSVLSLYCGDLSDQQTPGQIGCSSQKLKSSWSYF